MVAKVSSSGDKGAHIFAYPVHDPERYGVVSFNKDGKVFCGQRLDNKAEAWQLPQGGICLLYTSPSPRDRTRSRMPSSA